MNTAQTAPQTNNDNLIQKGDGLQVVIGLGQSGLATVNYLVKRGYTVAVTDMNDNPPLASQLPDSVSIRAFGDIDSELLKRASRIIISPGVPLTTPAVASAKQQGIPVVSDIQLFKDTCTAPIIAITGSNAKSTVTTLVGQMAIDAGINVGVGGNIGVPALSLLDDPDLNDMELAVLELSSFQLETVTDLGAKVACVLNMSPDHLDRHGDMLGYHQAKHRIFQGAKSVVISRDDALSRPLVADDLPRISFGSNAPDMDQYGLITEPDGTVYLAKGTERLLSADKLNIKGQHNLLNALSALALCESAGLPELTLESMLETLQHFAGLPHRCEFIANINGVEYFNDSKGTNVGSTKSAILGLGISYHNQDTFKNNRKLCLILGGQGKGQDFTELTPLINDYVSQVLFIGEDASKIEADLQASGLDELVETHQCGTLDDAMQTVQTLTSSSLSQIAGVLFSPACASFDQFANYAKRGERFSELVQAMQ